MADEEEDNCDCPEGIPAWVMTFADLMSLLMCFFVLLLSFSEMDVQRFKQIAGSMKFAFGVQRSVKAREIPKGTSIVAKEFSPGKPEPTIVNEVKQATSVTRYKNLQIPDEAQLATKADATKVAEQLQSEIESGKVEVDAENDVIIIRILDEGSFGSGSAKLNKKFYPVIKKIHKAVKDAAGKLTVSGHTDDEPISTPEYRSNWALSAARAVSVAHALMDEGDVGEERFEITGYADTKPLVPNDTEEHRAKNRRVEITIQRLPAGTKPKPSKIIKEFGLTNTSDEKTPVAGERTNTQAPSQPITPALIPAKTPAPPVDNLIKEDGGN